MKPPHPTKPLTSEELAREARQAGVEGDKLVADGTDPHLPASEAEELEREESYKPAPIDRALTELPPG